jgi:hypothetical protein
MNFFQSHISYPSGINGGFPGIQTGSTIPGNKRVQTGHRIVYRLIGCKNHPKPKLSDSCLLRHPNHGRTAVPAVRSFYPSGQARRLSYWFCNENRSLYPKDSFRIFQGLRFSRLDEDVALDSKIATTSPTNPIRWE